MPDSQPVTPPPAKPRFNTRLTLLCAALAVLAGIWLFTQFNDFPFYFHPDEPRKAMQVQEKWRNFHHPLLMLMVTDRTIKIFGGLMDFEKSLQNITELGRWISAIFSAVGIGALCVLAGRRSWWLSTLFAGVILLVQPDVFRFAHYFKEDTALLLGWALALLAGQLLNEKVSLGRLLFAGIALAVCASAKYVGIILLPLLLVFLVIHMRREKLEFSLWKALGAVLLAFVVAAMLINWRFVKEFESFSSGFGREMAGVTEGHRGVRPGDAGLFTNFYVSLLRGGIPWLVWPLTLAYFLVPVWQKPRSGRLLVDGLLISSALVYLVLISATPKISDRYLLPIVALLHFTAAAGAGDLVRLAMTAPLNVPRWSKIGAAAVLLVFPALLIHYNLSALQPIHKGYKESSIDMLVDWVDAGNLPDDAIILQTRRYLPDPEVKLFRDMAPVFPQKVTEIRHVDKTGSLQPLREAGISHILVSRGAYARYLIYKVEDLAGDPESLGEFGRQTQFYREMTETGQLVWEQPMKMPFPLHPGLELWEIPRTPTPAEDL